MKIFYSISLFLLFAAIGCSQKAVIAPEKPVIVSDKPKLEGDGLAKLAQKVRPDFLLGSFASSGINPGSADKDKLRMIFQNEFNIITIGIYMKSTQPQPQTFKYENIDDLVSFAYQNNISIYMHPLIGGNIYTADWVINGNFTASELKQIMRERIGAFLTRYGSKIKYVDVVNEAIVGSDSFGNTIWNVNNHAWLAMGWHDDVNGKWPLYLEEAFRIARESGGSSIKLIYNDNHNGMMGSAKANATLKLFNDFKKAGIPIDGIGMQFHCAVINGQLMERGGGVPVDFDSFASNMHRFADAGIEIHITEFDVHLPENPSESDYDLQATAFREVLKRCIEEPACKSFKMWGFTDKYGWRPLVYNPRELMLDNNFDPKKAYIEMKKMLEEKSKK